MAALWNARRKKRLVWALGGIVLVGVAAALILNAFKQNMVFFRTPSEIVQGEGSLVAGKPIRIGGMVEKGSIVREPGTLKMRFIVTDFSHSVPVVYDGIVPDLFRDGKGVVATGTLVRDAGGPIFRASEILAKHDENYMPPPVRTALKQASSAQK
jgi:cytochrome c-type biogenesis protein CcmE